MTKMHNGHNDSRHTRGQFARPRSHQIGALYRGGTLCFEHIIETGVKAHVVQRGDCAPVQCHQIGCSIHRQVEKHTLYRGDDSTLAQCHQIGWSVQRGTLGLEHILETGEKAHIVQRE